MANHSKILKTHLSWVSEYRTCYTDHQRSHMGQDQVQLFRTGGEMRTLKLRSEGSRHVSR